MGLKFLKLTKKEKEIVLAAAEDIAAYGIATYCCSSINYCSMLAHRGQEGGHHYMTRSICGKLGAFYGKDYGFPWLSASERDTRVLLLLTFAEVG